MEIKSYDIRYLDNVTTNIGTMFEYAVDNNIKHTPRNSAGYSMLAQYIVNFDKKKIIWK